MPVINPAHIPLVSPGNLFDILNDETTYRVRWLQKVDPVYYTVANRPVADSTFRQLIIARSVDNISLRLSHQANFPFIISPIIVNGALTSGLPLSWIWDIHVSIPHRWQGLRLAKIKRTSGTNGTGNYTGNLRLYFTAEDSISSIETYLFYVDYEIDSLLTYQLSRVQNVTDETPCLAPSEYETISGWVCMRTIDPDSDTVMAAMLTNILYPPVPPSTETTGEIQDSEAGGLTNPSDYSLIVESHGTGMLTPSSFNSIPALDMIIDNYLIATNYPFRTSSNRISSGASPITIPQGLFEEFSILAPNADLPTAITVEDAFPVWISKVERLDASADSIRLTFSTYDIDHPDSGYRTIEFATLTLNRSNRHYNVVRIESIKSLYFGKTNTTYNQKFGEGYVVLSRKWGTADLSSEVTDFFNSFATVPASFKTYGMEATILSSRGVSRVPKNIPTNGQFGALRGSKYNADPLLDDPPTASNPYVVLNDHGPGEEVKLSENGFVPIVGISDTCNKVVNLSPIVYMNVDPSFGDIATNFETIIRPRLEMLFGRPLQMFDQWFDGVRKFVWSGTSFIDM